VVKSVGLFVLSGSSVRTRIGGRPRWVGQSKAMGHDQFVMQLHTNCRHIVFDCGLSRTFLRSRPSGRLHHRCISWRPDGSRVRRLVKLAQKHVCWPRDSSRPLYQALTKTSEGLAYAEQVYAKARAGYHPLTQQAGWRSSLRRAESTSRLFVMRRRSNKYVD
jgi:hypothetical protein